MTFLDLETGKRYSGQLESENDPHGHPEHFIVLTPKSKFGKGKPTKVDRTTISGYLLIDATLDEISRLDRAGYHLRVAKDLNR